MKASYLFLKKRVYQRWPSRNSWWSNPGWLPQTLPRLFQEVPEPPKSDVANLASPLPSAGHSTLQPSLQSAPGLEPVERREGWGIWATVSHTFKRLEFSNARLESNLKTMWVVFMSKLFLNYQKMVMLTSWCYPESISPTTVTESVGRFPTSNDIFNLIASGQRPHIFLFLPDISGLQTCPQLQKNATISPAQNKIWAPTKMEIL